MTAMQKLERMEVIMIEDSFLPEYPMSFKTDALEFLKSLVDKVDNLSLRSLIAVTKIRAEGKDWEALAKYVVTAGA
jgi:hypothetical protein